MPQHPQSTFPIGYDSTRNYIYIHVSHIYTIERVEHDDAEDTNKGTK